MKIPGSEDFEAMRRIAETCGEIAKSRGWHEEEARAHQTLYYLEEYLNTFNERDYDSENYKAMKAHVGRLRAELKRTNGVPVLGLLALIASEIGEAVEVVRDPKVDPLKSYVNVALAGAPLLVEEDKMHQSSPKPYKPEGLDSEMADGVIRYFDLAYRIGVDLVGAIRRKMIYNATREYRHGGKTL
jgi:hypothetical protein